ncbi:MAG: hypothetical protein KDD53_09950, partial [Bdellovibrionales bacterium]|nr:hypothetical protein [Bdellovibrionales bacterium]
NACIDKFGDDWQSVFHHYQAIRKADTDAIADLAMDNFVEMPDSVANPKFLLKRELEHRLEEHFPDKFISKYAMVTFHRLPYSTAMKKGRIQDEVLMRICSDIHSLDGLNLSEVLSQVEQATTVI